MKVGQIRCPDAAWDDLDALVAEEMEALGGRAPALVSPPSFLDDEAFLTATLAYLDGHADRERLLAVFAREPSPPAPGGLVGEPSAGSLALPIPDPPLDKESGQ